MPLHNLFFFLSLKAIHVFEVLRGLFKYIQHLRNTVQFTAEATPKEDFSGRTS